MPQRRRFAWSYWSSYCSATSTPTRTACCSNVPALGASSQMYWKMFDVKGAEFEAPADIIAVKYSIYCQSGQTGTVSAIIDYEREWGHLMPYGDIPLLFTLSGVMYYIKSKYQATLKI